MDQYEHVRVIGKGSFGIVSKIVRKADNKELVWKEVDYGHMDEKQKQLIVSEVNILRELKHPHVVRYLDRVIDKQSTKIFIVMEYCEGGDLSRLIKRHRRDGTFVDEAFIWKVLTHMYLALKECHRHKESNLVKPILHRDIKPGNVFLDAEGNAKLGDFGLAKELSSESKFAHTNVGTPYYMSPEMVNDMTYDERSDIWALGCLIYELAALVPPFDATNQLALAKKINAGKFSRIPDMYSEDLFQAIRWMLHRQRSRRPRIEDLERVPLLARRLREYNMSSVEVQLQNTYAAKMKELFSIQEDLQKQEALLLVRETQIHERETELAKRELDLKRREQMVEMLSRTLSTFSPNNSSPCDSPTQQHSPSCTACSSRTSSPNRDNSRIQANNNDNVRTVSEVDSTRATVKTSSSQRSRHFNFTDTPVNTTPPKPASNSVPPSRSACTKHDVPCNR
ncbi:NEK protein kinase, variant [Aphanomyces invadans]|uniref:non-specific serine/threonine protein kinase n=1 Tax=Aphanomyces invadans TaxID=157072 RepID=A0A024TW06_9STRA|nr:NEK protein kinase, variant [Aphanomyces invadans]ETV97527.1 NEK protein kinase, variant [Aphanomyces invadans]|eukprot:XP_008873736.1 NEK protein kinase, variant [Aphanomyces invadans]